MFENAASSNPAEMTALTPATTDRVAISVVVPVLNEAESLESLCSAICTALEPLSAGFEILLVDDGSTDGTVHTARRLASSEPRLRLLRLAKNYGQTAAVKAGFDHVRGEIIVTLDADLQNDPADIPRLLNKLDQGFDVVSGWRRDRKDGAWRMFLSRVANRIISAVTGVRLRDYGCSLKAYRRSVIEGLRLYGEMHRFIPALAAQQGARIAELEVDHRPRAHGSSHYGSERIAKVILDLITVKFLGSYQGSPGYVFGGVGLLFLVGSGLPLLSAVGFKLMPEESGWQKDFIETPLLALAGVFFSVGVLALLQGLLAEMLMRTYYESQGLRTYRTRAETQGLVAPAEQTSNSTDELSRR